MPLPDDSTDQFSRSGQGNAHGRQEHARQRQRHRGSGLQRRGRVTTAGAWKLADLCGRSATADSRSATADSASAPAHSAPATRRGPGRRFDRGASLARGAG